MYNSKIYLITFINNQIFKKKLAEHGATTYLAAHLKEESMNIVSSLQDQRLDVKYIYFNALDEATHQSMIEKVIKAEDKINILVNNYGTTELMYCFILNFLFNCIICSICI